MSKIALFIPDFTLGSTIAKNRLKLAMGLIESGYKIDLIARRVDQRTIDYLNSSYHKDIKIIDFTNKKTSSAILSLANYLRIERPAALISSRDKANVVALLAKHISLTKTKLAIVEHTALSAEVANHDNYDSYLKPWTKFIKHLYPTADRIITVSQGVADDLASYFNFSKEKINTIYNPVITEDFFHKSQENPEHPWFQENIPIILGAGRLHPQKDFSMLLRAFAKLRANTNARLMIVGEGPKKHELKTLAESLGIGEDVAFTGYVTNPLPYMKNANVFAFSSQWEGFGNVLVEAMACGIPVVSTDCPSGPREILEDGKWGYLVKVGDADGMAKAIQKAMHDQRDQAVERAEFFNYKNSAAAYLNVLFPTSDK